MRDLHSRRPYGRLVYSEVRLTAPPIQQITKNKKLKNFKPKTINNVITIQFLVLSYLFSVFNFQLFEPTEGFEPPTHALQKHCSTTELCRRYYIKGMHNFIRQVNLHQAIKIWVMGIGKNNLTCEQEAIVLPKKGKRILLDKFSL